MLSKQDNELLTKVGPGTPMGNLFRRYWLPALVPTELAAPDSPPVRLRILGEDLIAFRDTTGTVGFVVQACPHRGASLFFGRNEEAGLRCVYHGWKFDVSGACTDMPSEPAESNFKSKVRVQAYPSAEFGGLVWIYMGPSDRRPPLPEYEWCHNDYPDLLVYKWMQESSYAQGLEGNIDTSHSAFLHRAFRNGNTPHTYMRGGSPDTSPQLEIMETDFGFVYGGRRKRPDGQYYWRVYGYVWPSFISIAAPTWDGAATMVIPMDDEHSWWFAVSPQGRREGVPGREFVELEPGSWRQTANQSNDYKLDRELQRTLNFTGLLSNRVQDAAVTESMGAVYDRSQEHLGTSDLAVIFMRRHLIKQAQLLEQGVEPALPWRPEMFRVRPTELVTSEPDLRAIWDGHHATYTSALQAPPKIEV